MSDRIVALITQGLSEEEAKVLDNFKERGSPGVSRMKPETFEPLYIMGYSCKDLHDQFPEYEYGVIIHARLLFKWDDKKRSYQANLASQVSQAAILAKAESIRFLFDVMAATHVKNRSDMMKYMANPEREKVPEFIPKTLGGYNTLVSMLAELTEPPASSKDAASAQGSPLVNITLSSGTAKADVEITSKVVGDSLIEEMKRKKERKDE